MRAEERLRSLGLVLPEPPEAVASYIPWVVAGGLIFISGQIPSRGGGLPRTGRLGAELTIEEGQEEARYCALNAHNPSVADPVAATTNRVNGELSGTGITVTFVGTACDTTVTAGDPVTVEIQTTFTPVTGVISGQLTLTASASMVMWQ